MQPVNTKEFTQFFGDALKSITQQMSGVDLMEMQESALEDQKIFAVIVGIVGAYKGRMLIRMCAGLVTKITEEMNCGPLQNLTETTLYIGEFSNILSGKAISDINTVYKEFDLRLTPPAIFSGTNMRIITPALQSSLLYYKSDFGKVSMDVGFERSR
ncbi:MAG: chemotaxis protein CheX [Fibrobacterota bacterium]|nr:chemotaxis protein CheX [Chitinispirillaceae bacterium]